VPPNAQVEGPEAVAAEGIGAALQDDGPRSEDFKALADDGVEDVGVGGVIDSVLQGNVDGEEAAAVDALLVGGARPREEALPVLVQGERHHAVTVVERLLDAVPVVHVNVNVEDAGVLLQKLQDGEDNVVDETKARGLASLCVMEAAGPVDGALCLPAVEFDGPRDGAPGCNLTELKEPVNHGAIAANQVEPLQEFSRVRSHLWRDSFQEAHIVVTMELHQVLGRGPRRTLQFGLVIDLASAQEE